MKKKLLSLLALVCMTLTASATAGYDLTVGTSEHGTIAFTVNGNARTYADEGETVTVTIIPATGWIVNQPSGQWYAAIAASRTISSGTDIGFLEDFTFTPVAGQENQWTFTMQRASAEISCTYKKLLDNTEITIEEIPSVTYTGLEQTPEIVMKNGDVTLVKDVDYTLSYSNNVNACPSDAEENAPTVTITAVATSQLYAGETTMTFTILKADIDDLTEPAAIEGLVYSSYDQKLVTEGSTEEGTILFSLDGEQWSEEVPTGYDAGLYDVQWKVTGDDNHNDMEAQTVTVEIIDMPMEQAVQGLFDAIYQAAETLSKGQYVHTEEENDALSAVIYDGAELYAAVNKPNNEVTPKEVVDMIKRLHEAEEAYLGEVPTGIENVNRNDNVNGNRYYDLNGRRVAQPTKGVYILNGKKVVIK